MSRSVMRRFGIAFSVQVVRHELTTARACECSARWARHRSARRLTSLIRHDYSLYTGLSLATELLTADVPVAAMAPRTWARPEKSAAGFHFGFRNGWNFGGAIGDRRRACQTLPSSSLASREFARRCDGGHVFP